MAGPPVHAEGATQAAGSASPQGTLPAHAEAGGPETDEDLPRVTRQSWGPPGAPPTSLSSCISTLPWAGNLCLLKETRYSSPAGGRGLSTAGLPPRGPGWNHSVQPPPPDQHDPKPPSSPDQHTRRSRGRGGRPREYPTLLSFTSNDSDRVRVTEGTSSLGRKSGPSTLLKSGHLHVFKIPAWR